MKFGTNYIKQTPKLSFKPLEPDFILNLTFFNLIFIKSSRINYKVVYLNYMRIYSSIFQILALPLPLILIHPNPNLYQPMEAYSYTALRRLSYLIFKNITETFFPQLRIIINFSQNTLPKILSMAIVGFTNIAYSLFFQKAPKLKIQERPLIPIEGRQKMGQRMGSSGIQDKEKRGGRGTR